MRGRQALKPILIILVVLVLVFIGIFLVINRSGSVEITAENNAEISIATEQDGEFKKIGNGKATYKSRDFSKPVYIQATSNQQKTISGVHLEKGSTKTVNLSFSSPVSATVLSEGSVFNAYIEGSLIQGIVPDEYTMTSFRTDRYETTRTELSGLPFMKKVVWDNRDNFVYISLRSGVGQFVNGTDLGGDSGFASSLSGASLPNVQRRDGQTRPLVTITDVAKAQGKPLVLISDSNIFTSPNLGTDLQSITGIKKIEDAVNEVYATSDYIIRYGGELPATSADESNQENSGADEHTKLLEIYDYSGKKIRDLEVHGESILNIAQVNTDMYILGGEELTLSKDGEQSSLPLYFRFVGDIASNQSKAFVLANNAVWQVSADGNSLQQVFQFPEGVGLEKSMVLQGNQLLFGTRPKPTDTDVIGKLYSLQF
jgi:hypothetical protein